jgi:hypothetical protein
MATQTPQIPPEVQFAGLILRNTVFPVVATVHGIQRGYGTGFIVGAGPEGYLWAVSATHIFMKGIFHALKKRFDDDTLSPDMNYRTWKEALVAGNISADLVVDGRACLAPIELLVPNEATDLSLLLLKLPESFIGRPIPALTLNSDDIPSGVTMISAGFQESELRKPAGPRYLTIGGGLIVEPLKADSNARPVYELTTPSVEGMSGGPLIRLNEKHEVTGEVFAVVSRGLYGVMDTIAISTMALYALRWDVPAVMGATSFRELLGTQINDAGTDKLVEVMSSNGRMFIRKSRIVNL